MNALRFRILGAAPGTYNVEATQTLLPPDWHVVGNLTVHQGEIPEFSEDILPSVQARFYRVSRQE